MGQYESNRSMTSPRHMPQFGIWSVPNCQLLIEYDLEVLESIRREVTANFGTAMGGLEIAGLLLGSYNGERVRITGFEPVGCEHALGPTFLLSQKDTDELAQQLQTHEEQAASGGERVVGWYESHARRGLALSAEDVKIYDRHFPQPWQVALLLRPAPAGSVHARFFLRESGGSINPAPPARSIREHRILPPRRAEQPVHRSPDVATSERETSADPLPDTAPPVEPETSADFAAAGQSVVRNLAEKLERTIRADARRRGTQNMAVWSVLAVMFVLAVASVFYLRFHFVMVARPPGVLPVEAGIRDGGLEIRWDSKAVGDARQGRLEVRNGSIVQQFTLVRETLVYGRFTCWPKSDVTSLRLRVDRPDGTALEGATTYVTRGGPVEAVVQAAAHTLPQEPAVTNQPPQMPPPPAPMPTKPALNEIAPKLRIEDHKPAPSPPTPAASRPIEPPKTEPPKKVPAPVNAVNVAKQEDPQKPKPESQARVPEPVQTAAEAPAQVQAPPSIQPPLAPAPRVVPQPAAVTPSPATPPQFRLGGRWVLQSGGYSRSPAVPESIAITVTDSDGVIHGVLEARYKSRSKTDRVHFSFSGKMVNGVARFIWNSTEDQPGQIEFIRVPSSPDAVEVVWQNPESKQVFDEMLKRASQ